MHIQRNAYKVSPWFYREVKNTLIYCYSWQQSVSSTAKWAKSRPGKITSTEVTAVKITSIYYATLATPVLLFLHQNMCDWLPDIVLTMATCRCTREGGVLSVWARCTHRLWPRPVTMAWTVTQHHTMPPGWWTTATWRDHVVWSRQTSVSWGQWLSYK